MPGAVITVFITGKNVGELGVLVVVLDSALTVIRSMLPAAVLALVRLDDRRKQGAQAGRLATAPK